MENAVSLLKGAQGRVRRRLKTCTNRRAPRAPQAFVPPVHPVVRGWVHDARHTKARQALRALQRGLHGRLRRYLTWRRKGRGFGWKPYPPRALAARGSISRGSRVLRYEQALCMLGHEDWRTAVCGNTALAVGWEGNGAPAMMRLVRHCQGNRSTARQHLKSLNHSLTLEVAIFCPTHAEAMEAKTLLAH
jgi:hypothetical protein